MTFSVPENIKLYHIVHIDRLPSIIYDGYLWSDANIQKKEYLGTTIGISAIKDRRLKNPLTSYPDLHVGECVPFYFCYRSVMLYLFYKNNHSDILYDGGQEPIIHLVTDLNLTIDWASHNNRRWVFTDSNAGSFYFNDYCNLNQLKLINWPAVNANNWHNCREHKQAEFLIENQCPFNLVESIGVFSQKQFNTVSSLISCSKFKPIVKIKRYWYY
jgi:hypothetical protein